MSQTSEPKINPDLGAAAHSDSPTANADRPERRSEADGSDDRRGGEAGDEATELTEPAEDNDVTFDEQFYPARPRMLRPSVRRARTVGGPTEDGLAEGGNPRYVEWLRGKSM